MAVCRGCGAVLQTTDPKAPGYTPKEGSSYCQRCFRLMHYDDLTISMRTGIDPDMVMNRLADMDVLILWTVDLFDFEAGMIPGLSRKLAGKDLILICTKRDLLPDTLNHEKIARFVFSRLKEAGIHIRELILTSGIRHEGKEEIMEAVHKYADGRKVAVMGRANSGKSTLLNELAGSQILASSRYPGTTLDFNELEIDGIPFIDTPGIEIQHSMLMDVKEEDLKTIIPARTIKPQIYQVRGNQSFAAGGLARLDVYGADHATVAWYLIMKALPQALFVVDTKREEIAVREANRLGIPVVGMLDTNSDPDVIDYGIPANDDAIRSVSLFCELVADAVLAGSGQAQISAEEMASGETAPAVETAEVEAPAAE